MPLSQLKSFKELAADQTALPRGTLSPSGKLLIASLVLAFVVIICFAWSYFQDWKRKRAFHGRAGTNTPKSRSRLWYYYHDWKRRRNFRRAWKAKTPKRDA